MSKMMMLMMKIELETRLDAVLWSKARANTGI